MYFELGEMKTRAQSLWAGGLSRPTAMADWENREGTGCLHCICSSGQTGRTKGAPLPCRGSTLITAVLHSPKPPIVRLLAQYVH